MTEQQDGQMTLLDPDTWCGKMSLEHSAATKARISESSSKKPQRSQIPKFLYLDLRRENGLTQDALWEEDTASLGESSTLNTLESPSVAVESHLSQILEANAHPKYCLSAKACQGILNRAKRRGKELPEMLRIALEHQAACCVSIPGTANQQDAMTQMEYGIHSTQMKTEDNQGILCSACKETESTEQTPQDATEEDGQTGVATL
jgi:hypothetical protein